MISAVSSMPMENEVHIQGLEETPVKENGKADLIVSNIPFGNFQVYDPAYQGSAVTSKIHDYFFAKSTGALKPGGVVALVTTHYTLDKQNAFIREYLADKADFVGAIRLPSDAFKREGTSVVTDIVFLRKRSLDEPPKHVDPAWLTTEAKDIDGTTVSVIIPGRGVYEDAYGWRARFLGTFLVRNSGR